MIYGFFLRACAGARACATFFAMGGTLEVDKVGKVGYPPLSYVKYSYEM